MRVWERIGFGVLAVLLAATVVLVTLNPWAHNDQVRLDQRQACADLYSRHFVRPTPDSRVTLAVPVWTDPVCATLSQDDQAAVFAAVNIAFLQQSERP
jgi:hypothetical protein